MKKLVQLPASILYISLVFIAFTSSCEKSEPVSSKLESSTALQEENEETFFIDHPALDIEVDTIRYLALGDSYTIGESVPDSGRWPVQLANRLSQKANIDVPLPTIIAQTGWTTANLSNGMDAANVDEEEFDIVSLLIGVNNQYQGLSIDQYSTQYEELLERAINIAGDSTKVIVVSIPDYGYTPFGVSNQTTISQQLATFNFACRQITLAHGVAHYDITPISQQWPETPDLIASDGLHPSASQYTLWVESFEDAVYQQIINQ